ncbi:MAG: histidine phosphatase family protein [Acidimicrobiia bacterium]
MSASELDTLWIVRHGQSLGNVARDAARGRDDEVLDIAERDMDVPLSAAGRDQAAAFGRWLATCPADVLPQVVLSSPYARSIETADVCLDAAGLDLRVHHDERLRERELGVLDLLTRTGFANRFPDEFRRRERLGKFYHRPPGGESWVDVALRLRSLRDSLVREHADRRVLVFTHEVVIILLRYLIEDLDEQRALQLSREERLANCSLTTFVRDADGRLVVDLDGWTAPLEAGPATVTKEHDAPVAPR